MMLPAWPWARGCASDSMVTNGRLKEQSDQHFWNMEISFGPAIINKKLYFRTRTAGRRQTVKPVFTVSPHSARSLSMA